MQEIHQNTAIIIPSRIGSTRLMNKPLKKIHNLTMIEWVVKQVQKTNCPNIYVATDSTEIADIVKASGCGYILTDSEISSGTDRVYAAFEKLHNKDSIEYIINVQGDMPFINPLVILSVIDALKKSNFSIITPVTKVTKSIADSNSNVKVVVDKNHKALYFSRSLIPFGANEFLYHIGVYGFAKKALKNFVSLEQCIIEKNENLEQLRALYNGVDIGVCYVDDIPISVDTEEDLMRAIKSSKNFDY